MTPILNAIYEGHVETVQALLAAVSARLPPSSCPLPPAQTPTTRRPPTLCGLVEATQRLHVLTLR